MAGTILTMVPDILVEMRIDSAARGLDAELESVSSMEFLEKMLGRGADVLVVDLAQGGLDIEAVVRAARAHRVPVIGFGPHVRAELLEAAKAAGMDAVYPRSAFVKGLAKILRERLSP